MANKSGKVFSLPTLPYGARTPRFNASLNKAGIVLVFGEEGSFGILGMAILQMSAGGLLEKTMGAAGQSSMTLGSGGQLYLVRLLVGQSELGIMPTGRLKKLLRQNKYTPIHRLISVASNNKIYYEVV